MKSCFFSLHVPIYQLRVFVSIKESDAKLFSRLKKHGYSNTELTEALEIDKCEHGVTNILSGNDIVIRIQRDEDRIEFIGTVQHESCHAADYILNRAGVKYHFNVSDEAYAYLREYIFKAIFKKLKL